MNRGKECRGESAEVKERRVRKRPANLVEGEAVAQSSHAAFATLHEEQNRARNVTLGAGDLCSHLFPTTICTAWHDELAGFLHY